jgi:hypothetical protein
MSTQVHTPIPSGELKNKKWRLKTIEKGDLTDATEREKRKRKLKGLKERKKRKSR